MMRFLPFVHVDTQVGFTGSENGIALDSTDSTKTSTDSAVSTVSTHSAALRGVIRSPNANIGAADEGQQESINNGAAPTNPGETRVSTNGVDTNAPWSSESGGSNLNDYGLTSTTSPTVATSMPSVSTESASSMQTTSSPSNSTSSILTTSTSITTTTQSISSSTTTSTSTPTSDPSAISGGPSKTTKIAVPVSMVGLAIILAIIFFLLRRRKRDRMSLPPPYHVAPSQTTAVSTQELMIAKPETRSITSLSMPMPLVSPTLPRSSTGGLSHPASQDDGHASQAELGTTIAVPVNRPQSIVEERTGSRQLARMPFEDFEDDEVGVGPAPVPVPVTAPVRVDDDAVSDVSDEERTERGGRRRDFDEVSELSFNEVSPVSPSSPEQRRFR